MSRIPEGIAPERVFHYFEEISGIPHGSGNCGQIAAYLTAFAQAHGLDCVRDEADNVVIRKGATAGYEQSPTVILQGHTDMVCAKTPESDHCFEKDGLRLSVDGDWLHADGTTLGGDDGIAVAYLLAILEANDLAHPALEAVFTTDEEIGLLGAKRLDCGKLQGRRLLNLDSEAEGILTVSCAGGSVTTVRLPKMCKGEAKKAYTVTVSGLIGGHSGAEIHKGHANAAVLAGELLRKGKLQVVSATGGEADNAIMTACTLVVCGEAVEETCASCERKFRARYPKEDIRVSCTPAGEAVAASVDLGAFFADAPYGVQAMSEEIEGLVQTSLNIGILATEEEDFVLTYSVRSSVENEKNALNARLHALAKQYGGTAATSGEYPAWEYRKESPLRDTMCEVYARLYGKEMQVEAIHAGLECGLFAGGMPGLDAVSFGPDMRDIHTAREALSVSSVARTYAYLCAVLAALR